MKFILFQLDMVFVRLLVDFGCLIELVGNVCRLDCNGPRYLYILEFLCFVSVVILLRL